MKVRITVTVPPLVIEADEFEAIKDNADWLHDVFSDDVHEAAADVNNWTVEADAVEWVGKR